MSEPELLQSEEIRRRLAEKAALVAELEARNPHPRSTREHTQVSVPAPAKSITAEPAVLSKLVRNAARANRRALHSAEVANEDRILADDARKALDAYMRENGLA